MGTVDGFYNLLGSDGLDRQNVEEVNAISDDTLTTGRRVYKNESINDEGVKWVTTKLKQNKSLVFVIYLIIKAITIFNPSIIF